MAIMNVEPEVKPGTWRRGGLLLGGIVFLGAVLVIVILKSGDRQLQLNASNVAAPAGTPVTAESKLSLGSEATQKSEGGDVTVSITWQGPGAGMVFDVAMDTHVVDLDGYDLSRLVVLRTTDGRETPPLRWDAPKGGHHRKGALIFSDVALDSKPFITADTRGIELVIYDVAGVAQRSFRWTLR